MKFPDLVFGGCTIAIFPSVMGFGWIVFDGPLSPVDWGVSSAARKIKGDAEKNGRCIERLEALINQYGPTAIILEEFERGSTRRAARIGRLCHSIIALAAVNGTETRIISRTEIRSCFASASPRNRYDVAKIVASYLPEIRFLLPPKRKLWENEAPIMALFNAAALLITHYANPKEPL